MKFCSECGNSLAGPPNPKFCPECGHSLRSSSISASLDPRPQSPPRPPPATDLQPVAKRLKFSPTVLSESSRPVHITAHRKTDGARIEKRPASTPWVCAYASLHLCGKLQGTRGACNSPAALGRHEKWHREQGHVLPVQAPKNRCSLGFGSAPTRVQASLEHYTKCTYTQLTLIYPSCVNLFGSPHYQGLLSGKYLSLIHI